MRYIQPYGSTDRDGPYADSNPAAGIAGSVPAAEMVEHPLRELEGCIGYSGIQPTSLRLDQLTHSIRSQYLNFAVDVGTANNLVVEYYPLSGLTVGLPLRVFVAFDNTGSSTIMVNGIGPVFIIRANGASLAAGDLIAGEVATLVYDGAYFQLTNYLGHVSDVTNNNHYVAKIPYCEDTSTAANTINAPFDPVITALPEGLLIEVKIANQNTGATIIYVNALSSRKIKVPSPDGFQDLAAGQLKIGMVALLVYDGVQFQLVNAPAAHRHSIISTVNLIKRYTYQSPSQVQLGGGVSPSTNLQIFTCNYTPVKARNRLRIQVTGAIGYSSTSCPSVAVYLAYRTSNQPIWIPPSFPGPDYPAQSPPDIAEASLNLYRGPVPGLMANTGQLGFVYQNGMIFPGGTWEQFVRNFVISAHMPVPEGPPGTITFGLFFRPRAAEEAWGYVSAADMLDWRNRYLIRNNQIVFHFVCGGAMLQVYEYDK